MFKSTYSKTFYAGLIIIIISLIMGKVGQYFFFFRYEETTLRWVGLIVYFSSWPLTLGGIWWVGKEYADKIKKYVSYKFYTQSLKSGTKRVVKAGARGTMAIGRKVKGGTEVVGQKTIAVGSHVKNKLKKRKEPSWIRK